MFFASNVIASFKLLESLENGPLHTTAFIAGPATSFAEALATAGGLAA
jgi:hypothetical protein